MLTRYRVKACHPQHASEVSYELTATYRSLVAIVASRLCRITCHHRRHDVVAASIGRSRFVVAQVNLRLANLAKRRARATDESRIRRTPSAKERRTASPCP